MIAAVSYRRASVSYTLLLLVISGRHNGRSLAFQQAHSFARPRAFGTLNRPSRVATFDTRYTIDEPPTDVDDLSKVISKHWDHLSLYVSSKPVAAHTRAAFEQLQERLATFDRPVILDSGCGTGRFTNHLGEKYPDHVIIGVDRSVHRLGKNPIYSKTQLLENKEGVFLLRAELADFWRMWHETPLATTIDKHFLYYPNPYPKKRRLSTRWYGHPIFPILLLLNSKEIIVRSNWRAYLEDFELATDFSCQHTASGNLQYTSTGIIHLDPSRIPFSNFEAKYLATGESTYELRLLRENEI